MRLTPINPGNVKNYIVLSLYLAPAISKRDQVKTVDFLTNTLADLVRKYPLSVNEFTVSGDFNRVPVEMITQCLPGLVNLSVVPTKRRVVLDYFLTTNPETYQLGEVAPPLGYGSEHCSDHLIVVIQTRKNQERKNLKKVVKKRPLPDSSKAEFEQFLLETDWKMLRLFDADEAAEHLENTLNILVDELFPEKTSKINVSKNKPWYNHKLAKLKERVKKVYLKKGATDEYLKLDLEYKTCLKEAKRKFKDEKIVDALK